MVKNRRGLLVLGGLSDGSHLSRGLQFGELVALLPALEEIGAPLKVSDDVLLGEAVSGSELRRRHAELFHEGLRLGHGRHFDFHAGHVTDALLRTHPVADSETQTPGQRCLGRQDKAFDARSHS